QVADEAVALVVGAVLLLRGLVGRGGVDLLTNLLQTPLGVEQSRRGQDEQEHPAHRAIHGHPPPTGSADRDLSANEIATRARPCKSNRACTMAWSRCAATWGGGWRWCVRSTACWCPGETQDRRRVRRPHLPRPGCLPRHRRRRRDALVR